jgi:hypothetical protein
MKTSGILFRRSARGKSLIACSLLLLGISELRCLPQDTKELKTIEDPVPELQYKTWSLFLVPNPDWLLEQSDAKLGTLYRQFQAFGKAIGQDNLAVWFWSQKPQRGELRDAMDTVRAAAFCKQLKLKPSEGPYVLVMTTYPGKCVMSDYPGSFPQSGTNLLVIKLNGTDATATGRLLADLADKLVAEDLAALHSKTDDYWAGWRRAFSKISGTVLDVANKVTITLDTGPVKTAIKLGS